METHFRELDAQGYTLLEDLLTPEQIARAIAALDATYEEDRVSDHERGSKRTHNLTARAEIFRDIIQLPRLVACMEYLLGTDYILSDMGARSPMPGMQAQSLHRDGGPFVPNPPYNVHSILPLSAQSLIALSEFTRKNGATRFVPASHLRDIEPQDVPPAQEELLLCQPGTALIYDSRLIHGGSAYTSDQIRSIPPKIVAGATPLMRRLWGFESQSAWEQSPRDFKIVEAPGAKPRFDYNRRD